MSHAQPGGVAEMPTSLGLRLPANSVPTVAWLRWQVVDRAHGFHVSRESAGGHLHDFVRNEVGAVKVFRARHYAQAACDARNAEANQ